MNRKYGDTSPETLKRLKEYYLSSTISIAELARISERVCGQKIAPEALVWYVSQDPQGDWEVTRNSLNYASSEDVSEEVSAVRKIVYQQIVAMNESGLLIVGAFDEGEIRERLADMKELKIVRIRPGGVDAAMVNAYMNLLAKTNVQINVAGSSAKTSREQGIDYIRHAMREISNGH